MRRDSSLMMSPIGIIVGIFLFVVVIITIGSLIDPTLEKLGMETRSHLKAELAKSKDTINTLKENISTLQKQKEILSKQCTIKEEVLDDYHKELNELEDFIKEVTNSNQTKKPIIDKELIKTESVSPPLTINEEDLTNNNIVALHNVYDNLFGG